MGKTHTGTEVMKYAIARPGLANGCSSIVRVESAVVPLPKILLFLVASISFWL